MKLLLYLKGSRGNRVLSSLLLGGIEIEGIIFENASSIDDNIKLPANTKVFISDKPKEISHQNWEKTLTPDLTLAAGYSKILPLTSINMPRFGTLNCHGGKLPEYRGASPIPWQLINGEKHGAAYILEMTSGIDDGPIIDFAEYEIRDDENATNLVDKVDGIFEKIALRTVRLVQEGKPLVKTEQPSEGTRVWTRRYPRDGQINWQTMTAVQIVNFVRALAPPYPGAFSIVNSSKVNFLTVKVHPEPICGVPGRYVGVRSGFPTILAKDRAVAIEFFEVDGIPNTKFPAVYGDDVHFSGH